jgi:hypothetical protein
MATTTPNYGWTVPTSTDLVKDGATAIETLGDAIDASMNTALGTNKAMGVLLSTVSFSGVSSQSVNDVFSATYDNYRVIANISQSADVAIALRVRVGGSDLTTSTYKFSRYFNNSSDGAYANSASNSATSIDVPAGLLDRGFMVWDFGNPFNAFNTHIQNRTSFINSGSSSFNFTGSASVNNTTSYTGFTLFPTSGTITGNVSVYGYNK